MSGETGVPMREASINLDGHQLTWCYTREKLWIFLSQVAEPIQSVRERKRMSRRTTAFFC